MSFFLWFSFPSGHGLFTNDVIEVGGFVVEYAGEIITKKESIIRNKRYENEGRGCFFYGFKSSW